MNRWEARRARTRTMIKDAACATFLEGGYLETTVEQLIIRAGVSRATFYDHFSNKIELLEAIAEDHIRSRHDQFQALTELEDFSEPRIMRWLDEIVEHSLKNQRAVALYRLAVALNANIMKKFGKAREENAVLLAPHFCGFDTRHGNREERLMKRVAAITFIVTMEQFLSGISDGSWTIEIEATKSALARNLLKNK